MGSVTKSYMRKGFLIYEEMRKYLVTCEKAVSHLQPIPPEFPYIYEEKCIFFFYQCTEIVNMYFVFYD
jgi:hypothetical protein